MLEKFIKEGNKVEMRRLSAVGKEDGSGKYYVSKVYDLFDDNRVGILVPTERGEFVPLDIGSRLKLCFYTDEGLYQCKCMVKERFKKDRYFILVVKFTSDLEKLQRRQFFRISCIIKVRYRKPPQNEEQTVPWQEATAVDISGGGMRFNSVEYRGDDNSYEIEFDIPLDNLMVHFKVIGRIVYISDLANRSGMYEYRLEFMGLQPKQREAIVRYVFDEERRRRKKI